MLVGINAPSFSPHKREEFGLSWIDLLNLDSSLRLLNCMGIREMIEE